jgi:putative ATP-dependent endonuclease of OLD family
MSAGQEDLAWLFDYVLVTADLRASEETQDSRAAVLGRLLERTVDRTAADAELHELASGYLERQAEIHAKYYAPRLGELSTALSRSVATFTQGRSVRISTVNADPKLQRVQFSLSIQDGKADTSVDRQGHGFQRALLIATLKALADQGAQAEQPGVICLAIEEPELFQHPVQARAFASVLRKLAQDGQQQIQVTYATHSPFFIEAAHFPQVRRVSRCFDNDGSVPAVKVTHVTPDRVVEHLTEFVEPERVRRRMEALCIDMLPEAMFAEAVILVEGTTDQAVLEGCAERNGAFLGSHGIEVVEVNGKGGILLPYAILKLLGVPCYLVFDGDRDCGNRMRAKGKNEAQIAAQETTISQDNRRILRYFGATEEDWPATGVHDSYAVYGDCLETELTADWPEWQARADELVSTGAGFLGKNRATYRYATATAAGEAPGLLQEILAAARRLRGERVPQPAPPAVA